MLLYRLMNLSHSEAVDFCRGVNGAVMSGTVELDERVLASRTQGLPFAAIAREFALEGAGDAYQAFLRAFRRRPLLERARIRQEELARLDYLRTVVQTCPDYQPDQIPGRLLALQRMRDSILAG